ncbi:6846_t:CDS:2, partial [Dentiscutata heterogama]
MRNQNSKILLWLFVEKDIRSKGNAVLCLIVTEKAKKMATRHAYQI